MIDSLAVIERAIKSGKNAPVWVLWGQELWAKKQVLASLKKHLVPEGMEAFNYDHFYATETSAATVIDSALTLAMMADQKLVYVENCQKWDLKQRKHLLEYFKNPNQGSCLLLDFDLEKTGKYGKFFKTKHDGVQILEFPKPSPWDLEKYISRLAKSCGVKLDKASTALLAEYTGDDIELMRRELEKLQIYTYGKTDITAEDVEALTGRTRLVNRWELQKKLGTRDIAKALEKSLHILESGETPIGLLSVVSRYIGQLLKVKALMADGVRDPKALAQKIHLPVNIATPLLQEHRKFSGVELRNALKNIAQSDDLLKGSSLSGGNIIARLVSSLLESGPWSP